MAKINKQEIIQKLVDELNLYPGKDLIPSELADKILAVYQINTQDVNVSITSNHKIYEDATLNDIDKTFVVPAGKKWKVLYGSASLAGTATVGDRFAELQITNASDVIKFREGHTAAWTTASATGYIFINPHQAGPAAVDVQYSTKNLLFSFPKEIVLEEGWKIRLYEPVGIDAADDMVFTLIVDEQDM